MSRNSAKQNIAQIIDHLKAKGLWKKPTDHSKRASNNRTTVKSN